MGKSLVPTDKTSAAKSKSKTQEVAMSSMALNDAAAMLAGFSIMPDQLAKNHSELADKRLGGYVSNLIGYHWGDALAHKRVRNWIKLCQETEAIFQRRGTGKPEDLSPNLAAPILEACMDEDREEIQKLWAGLLATARDPQWKRYFKLEFVDIIKKLDPSDAHVLQTIYEYAKEDTWYATKNRLNPSAPHQVLPTDILRNETGLDPSEIEVSLGILLRHNLLERSDVLSEPRLSATGKLFIKAVICRTSPIQQ